VAAGVEVVVAAAVAVVAAAVAVVAAAVAVAVAVTAVVVAVVVTAVVAVVTAAEGRAAVVAESATGIPGHLAHPKEPCAHPETRCRGRSGPPRSTGYLEIGWWYSALSRSGG
jgi:hypothetical protein